ncbi:MAG: hypothetical protein ACJAXM_001047 [Arenicella sp.]|jgi:hypothetical protein
MLANKLGLKQNNQSGPEQSLMSAMEFMESLNG